MQTKKTDFGQVHYVAPAFSFLQVDITGVLCDSLSINEGNIDSTVSDNWGEF